MVITVARGVRGGGKGYTEDKWRWGKKDILGIQQNFN